MARQPKERYDSTLADFGDASPEYKARADVLRGITNQMNEIKASPNPDWAEHSRLEMEARKIVAEQVRAANRGPTPRVEPVEDTRGGHFAPAGNPQEVQPDPTQVMANIQANARQQTLNARKAAASPRVPLADEDSPFAAEPPDWLGATPPPPPGKRARQPMTGDNWRAIVMQQGLEWGLRPEKIEAEILNGRSSLSMAEAQDLMGQMEREYGPGYSEARAKAQVVQGGPHTLKTLKTGEEIPYSFQNRGEYRALTEAGREMYRSGIPTKVTEEERDQAGNVRLVKKDNPEAFEGEGYNRKLKPGLFWRQNQARAGSLERLRATSFWATGPGGVRYTSTSEEKTEKRKAIEIGHQMVRVGDEPVLRGLKAGPGSGTGEEFQTHAAFMPLTEVGPSGQGYIDVGLGQAHKTLTRVVYQKEGQQFTGEPTIAKGRLQVANELVPERLPKGWTGTITASEPAIDYGVDKKGNPYVRREGRAVQVALSRPIEGGQWALKDWWAKAMLEPVDLSGARTKEGKKVDIIAPVKDWQGAVHSLFQAEWASADAAGRERLAQDVGVPLAQLTDYASSGKTIYEAFGREQNPLLQRYVTTASWSKVIHQSQLERYQHLITAKEEAPDIGQGFYRATLSAPGLYAPSGVATRVMQEYNNRRELVTGLELERMQRAEEEPGGIPGQVARILRMSRGPRQRARELIQTYQANQEPALRPENAIDLSTPEGKAIAMEALGQAQASVRANARVPYADTEEISPGLLVRPFFQALAGGATGAGDKMQPTGGRMLAVPTATGQAIIPPARTILGSQATGRDLEHGLEREVSPLLTSAFGLITNALSGGAPEETDEEGNPIDSQAERYQAALEEAAGSPDARRIAEGALLPRGYATGRKLLGSGALKPGEAYVPGMSGYALQLTGNPTGGTPDYMAGLLHYGISKEEAIKRGMDPGQMYAPEELATALGRDYDADTLRARKVARAKYENGQALVSLGRGSDRRTIDLLGPAQQQALHEAMAARVKLGRHDVLTDYPQERKSEGDVLKALQGQPLTELNPQKQFSLAEAWRQARNVRVGTHYNPFLRYLGVGRDPAAYKATEKLFELSYARTQTPIPELPELQRLFDIRKPSWKGGIHKELEDKPGSIRGEAGGLSGMTGAMAASYNILRDLIDRGVYTPEEAAAVSAPPELRATAAGAFRQTGTRSAGVLAFTQGIGEEGWAGSVLGAGIGGGWIANLHAKAKEEGLDPYAFTRGNKDPEGKVRGLGKAFTNELQDRYLAAYQQGETYRALRQKASPLAEWVGAAKTWGENWLLGGKTPAAQPVTTQPPLTSQQAAESNVRAAIQPGQGPAPSANAPVLRPENQPAQPSAQAQASAARQETAPEPPGWLEEEETDLGPLAAGSGAGQPPIQPPAAPPAAATPPGDGGRRNWRKRYHAAMQSGNKAEADQILYAYGERRGTRLHHGRGIAKGSMGGSVDPSVSVPKSVIDEDDFNRQWNRRMGEMQVQLKGKGNLKEGFQVHAELPEMAPWELEELKELTGPTGKITQQAQFMAELSANPTRVLPVGYENKQAAWFERTATKLNKWSNKIGGAGPAMAKDAYDRIAGTNELLQQRQFQREIQIPEEPEYNMPGLAFRPEHLVVGQGAHVAQVGLQIGRVDPSVIQQGMGTIRARGLNPYYALKENLGRTPTARERAELEIEDAPYGTKFAGTRIGQPRSEGVKLTASMQKEIEAREKLVKAIEAETEQSEKLYKENEKYLRQTGLASPKAMEQLGRVRQGVEEATERARSGQNLRPEDVRAIREGRKHLAPEVRGQAKDLFATFGPEGIEADRARGAARRAGGWDTVPGRMMSGLESIGWTMFNVNRAWRMTGGAMAGWAQQYAGEQMLAQQANWNVTGQGGLTGAPLQALQRHARMAQTTSQLGAAAMRVYGPTIDRLSQNFADAPEGRQDAIVKTLGGAGALAIGGFVTHGAYRIASPLIKGLTQGASLAPLAPVALGLGAMSATADSLNPYNLNAPTGPRGMLSTLLSMSGLGSVVSGLQSSAQAGLGQSLMKATPFLSGMYQTLGMQPAATPTPSSSYKDMQERIKDRSSSREVTDQQTIVKAMVEEGYAPEETYQLLAAMTGATGEKPTLGEVMDKAQAARMSGTTPSATIGRAQNLAAMVGALPGSKGYSSLLQRAMQPEWQQQQVQAAQGIWGNALLQTNLSPEQRYATLQTLGANYVNQIPAIQQYSGAVESIFASRGKNMPVYAPETLEALRGAMGATPAQMNYMAAQYATPMGWSLRQPMQTLGGGGWQAGMYESTPRMGLQELGTSASFDRQWRALQRSYSYRMGSAGGPWTPGSFSSPTTFGGGHYDLGAAPLAFTSPAAQQPVRPTSTVATSVAGAPATLQEVVRAVFPKEVQDAFIKIGLRESGGRPDAVANTAYPDRPGYRPVGPNALPEYSVGLFQINTLAHTQYSPDELKDPRKNAEAAYKLYQKAGFSPWRTTSGETVPGGEPKPAAKPGLFGTSVLAVPGQIQAALETATGVSAAPAAAADVPRGLQGELRMHQDLMDLTKTLRALDKSMIEANRRYEGKQLGFALEGANLSYRQGLENLALQEKTWSAQVSYQRRELGIQGQQMRVQQGWTRQDLSYQQSMAGLQYGWQQEDFTRNIRFATGRERQQLRREQTRAQITYAMEESQRGRERERFETSAKWQTEALGRQKEYFEQMASLQEEQFALQRKHLTEQHELQIRQISAQMAHQQEMWGLEDQRWVLEKDWEDRQQKYREQQIKDEIALATLEQDDAVANLTNEQKLAEARGQYNLEQVAAISPGGELWEAWGKLVEQIKTWLEGIKLPAQPGSVDSGNTNGNDTSGGNNGKAVGGYINRTGPALLHAGEYVMSAREVLANARQSTVLPQPATIAASQGACTPVVHVYLGTQELKALMVETVNTPAMAGALADSSRRANNRRL